MLKHKCHLELQKHKDKHEKLEKLNNNSDEMIELQKMSELVKNISNREALKDKIHEIHNFLRNSGAGYGMNALKVFNFLYGLKKIETFGLIDKYELKKPKCLFSHLLQKAKEEKNEEITELILSDISECIKESRLSRVLYYELPQNIKANVFSHLVKEIESISDIEKTCNVLLSGKIYEYFIGRDETAISELGAYFTDRHIVNYILRKLNPVLLENGRINDMIDMFGGSGGFTTGYIDYLNEKYPDQIEWSSEIAKIHHYDINEDVIKSASLEILCMTQNLPDVENITYRNAFTSDFEGRDFTYILTNPPYGGDKIKQSDIQIKREKIKNFIRSQIASNTLDAETLKNRNIQLKKIEKEERQEKKDIEKTKVCISSCSDRIQIFASKYKLSGSDKESCSLILMMELLAKNGTAIGVLKEGVFFNRTYTDLRKCLIENFNVVEIISIPQDQFENTSTKTSIVIFQNTDQKTTEIRFSDLVVEKNEVDEFAELNGHICMIKNKGDISNISDKLVSIARVEDILMNPICSLNAKDYNKKVIVCGDGYELVRLGDICETQNGYAFKTSEYKDNGIPLITITHIKNEGLIFNNNHCIEKNNAKYKKYEIQANDLIISLTGKKPNLVNIALNTHQMKLYLNQRCAILRNFKKINNYYFLAIFNGFLKNQINKYIGNGSNQENVSLIEIQELQIPIPKSQAKIQEWVDKISRPYDKMNSNKSRINELETFVQMRIKEISENEDCELVELRSVCEYIKTGKNKTPDDKKGLLYPYYGTADITGYTDYYLFDGKHILVARNGTMGNCFLVEGKIYPSDHIFVIKNKKEYSISFIFYLIKELSNEIKNKSNGSTIKGISKENLSNIKIHIPKNKQLIQDLEPTFQEIETLQTEMKESEVEYKKLIKELSEEAIPNQETQPDVPETSPEPEQPEVVDEPVQDEIVIKKKSSTKTTRKSK